MEVTPTKEADLFARYLGAGAGDADLLKRYTKALAELQIPVSSNEQELLNRIKHHPFLLPYVDAGLAYLNPTHTVRRRILLMSALMETEVQYTHLFLTTQNISYPLLSFLYRCCLAFFRGVTGVLLLKIIGWK